MMQSTPLNPRRAVIWLGRLILGPIFLYAGYSKIFLPNTNFWPMFVLKFSISVNLANFARQVEAFKMLSPSGVQFVAHTLPFTEITLGLLLLIGWRLRIWATLLTAIMLGFLFVVSRAYLLHMDINCGCFATPEPINLKKIAEDAALSALAILMTWFSHVEASKPHPWTAPSPTRDAL
jgi:uncharacterized membrane protein YphA (DoxX/SURF4 family)